MAPGGILAHGSPHRPSRQQLRLLDSSITASTPEQPCFQRSLLTMTFPFHNRAQLTSSAIEFNCHLNQVEGPV